MKLVVIRSANPNELVMFYSLLGLVFEKHKHDAGPVHHSATLGGAILEIYPLAKSQASPDLYLRLGITIDDFEEKIRLLKQRGIIFQAEPGMTDFGYLAIVEDPEGRKVELYRST